MINNTCQWCNDTSAKIDSIEWQNEQLINAIKQIQNHQEVKLGTLVNGSEVSAICEKVLLKTK